MSYNIVFVHLLNDFSGSPKVLTNTINAIASPGKNMKLYVGSSGEGFLSTCDIPVSHYWYYRSEYKLLTFISYFTSQVLLFCKLFFDRKIGKDSIIYINTVLPAGAAIYGKLTGRKVIFHIHEISISPDLFRNVLISIVSWTSSLNIYVSGAHIRELPIAGVPICKIYNTLDKEFLAKADESIYIPLKNGRFNILMISSLRAYKGIAEFIQVASSLVSNKKIMFELVVNDSENNIERYFSGKSLPRNVIIHSKTKDVNRFYENASLVMNLSRTDQWVETFGLTILESMAFGIPVIVPPVGGPAEIVEHGVQGIHLDSRNINKLVSIIREFSEDPELCLSMSEMSRKRAKEFSFEIYSKNIRTAVNDLDF